MAGGLVAPAGHEGRPPGFLALMGNRNYALLWTGQLVSEVGNRFHWVAVSLWVFQVTQSAAAVSLAIASMFVGGLLVSLWAGPLVDRLNRRAILIVADIVRGALVLLIPSLMSLNVWFVYVDLALISIATAFFRPAILAVVPQIVPKTHILPANSFFTAMDTATEIGGPVVAGLIAEASGYAPLLYADGLTYFLSALCIAGMAVRAPVTEAQGALSFKGIWEGAIAGLRYLRTDKLQSALFVLIFPATIVGSGLNALQTPLAKGVVGITDFEFGVFQGVWGSGFLVASLLLGWFGAKQRRSTIMLIGFFMAFLSTGSMGFSATLEFLLLTGFLVGFANTLYYVGTTTILMEYTPEGVIGRVLSTRQLAISSVRVISPLVFGAFADVFGIRSAVVSMALLGIVGTALAILANPAVWRFESAIAPSATIIRAWEATTGSVHSGFDSTQQRRLSFGLLAIVLMTWIALLSRVPLVVVFSILTVAILWAIGRAVRAVGWKQ